MVEMTFALGAVLSGSFTGAFGKAGQALGELQKQTSSLQKTSGQIGAFQKMQGAVQASAQKLSVARARVKELGQQMRSTGTPTAALRREFTSANVEAHRLEVELGNQRRRLGELRGELRGAGVDTGHLSTEQTRLTQQTQRLTDAQTRLQRSRASLQATREQLSWSNVKGDLFKAAGIGLSLGAPVMQAAEFEHAAARLNAVAFSGGGRNKEEDAKAFKALQEQARQLGRDTQFTAVQAAQSQENLARAGFAANEIIAAMPGLLDMAAAEGMDLATAADIMASSLRGFGLEASDAARVSNILAQTSAASNSSIVGLGESLKYVAPVAKGLGVSIEETNAMLGIMANAGIKGSQGGTALRAAFVRLSKEPKAVAKALAQLGISARDAKGNFRDMPELMQALSKRMKDMGSADKMKYLSNIFGSEAASGMLAVMEASVDGSLQQLTRLNRESSGQLQALSQHIGVSLDDMRAGMT
ncbi:MAG: phage tail tape measure protein, partial [Synergistaceae bacterium]|nr:phage tail tape measure protein [Synergistaceae bacterium]